MSHHFHLFISFLIFHLISLNQLSHFLFISLGSVLIECLYIFHDFISVRERAKIILELVHDDKRLRAEREKAQSNQKKFLVGIGSGAGSGYGGGFDSYEGTGGGFDSNRGDSFGSNNRGSSFSDRSRGDSYSDRGNSGGGGYNDRDQGGFCVSTTLWMRVIYRI